MKMLIRIYFFFIQEMNKYFFIPFEWIFFEYDYEYFRFAFTFILYYLHIIACKPARENRNLYKQWLRLYRALCPLPIQWASLFNL